MVCTRPICTRATCARNNAGTRKIRVGLDFLLVILVVIVILVVVVLVPVFVVIVVVIVIVIGSRSQFQRRHAADIQVRAAFLADQGIAFVQLFLVYIDFRITQRTV